MKLGRIEYDTASALKELDPVSWNIAHGEWIDTEVSDGNLITFDNGSNYFWQSDIEQFIDDSVANGSSSSG